MLSPFIFGVCASLASAAAWALGTVLFSRMGPSISPLGMNLCRGALGVLFLAIPVLLAGVQPFDPRSFLFLAASGLLGITLGDTFFFKTLMQLGPRLTALIGALGPVITSLAAVIFLGERPSILVWVGIFLTVGGVSWLLWEKNPLENEQNKDKTAGIIYGLLFVGASAAGIVLAKVGVTTTSALWATFLRIAWGTMGLLCWGLLTRRLEKDLLPFRDIKVLKSFAWIVLIGVFGGFWLFLVSLQYIDVSIASALNSTTPLFILPMAAIIAKEKISRRAVFGAIIAVAGVMLILIH